MSPPHSFRLCLNPHAGIADNPVLPPDEYRCAKAEITGWNGYAPTPLHDLPTVAGNAGVAAIRLKDESGRFGLGSFKALGGAYAAGVALAAVLARLGGMPGDVTLTSATDGNHGRAVAWGSVRLGCRCVIFVHATVSQARVDAIAAFGAEVRRVPGTYDDAVRAAELAGRQPGWVVVSDTSWPGYTDIPRAIMQGYRLMADEAAGQWQGAPPTHVFIQAGVGGVAAAVSVQLRDCFTPAPRLVVVEPRDAACLLASAEAGRLTSVSGTLDTLMAGLACGEPSLLAWQELTRSATAFMAIPDQAAVDGMRLLAEQGIVSGESGAAGLAGFRLAAAGDAARAALHLGSDSRVLLFSTEGATDRLLYQRLTGHSPEAVGSQQRH
ncbi:MAG TPA: diaminopropionate ammonia-lyase [Acetobacteraceae bacterium]|nr:diaminopropionate ammonia-lyase [Acetobacteraceae bacterium]